VTINTITLNITLFVKKIVSTLFQMSYATNTVDHERFINLP